jgi:hypothetical protein
LNAAGTLQAAHSEGVCFCVSPVGKLKAIGDALVVEKWALRIQEHKAELVDLLRDWERLHVAIVACCEARGDTEDHGMALLADCRRESPADWGWWANYFRLSLVPRR